ncbi:MAG: PIN domain-containing protein [Methylococcales bacterium]|nr:PIN domain-containing protein [Methylococcales bacterium]
MDKFIFCDTCILIDFVNGRSHQVLDLHTKNIQIFINPVVELELLQGARNKVEMHQLEKALGMFHLLELPDAVLQLARQLIKVYAFSHRLRLTNALIAATVLVYDLELFTYNVKDFRFITELKFYDA